MGVIQLAPPRTEQRLRMSYEEFLEWSDEDTHAEWVDGEVIVFIPAKPVHQNVVNFLETLLTNFVEFFQLGRILAAPLEMKVRPGGNAREPDLLFISNESLGRLTEDRLEGPADLIVEVVSRESVRRDRQEKFEEYQEASVPEYWVLDPRQKQERAEFWVLDEQGHYQAGVVDEDGIYRSTVIPGFWLRVAWLWQEEKPNPLYAFAEIAGFSQEMMKMLDQLAARGPQ